MAEKNDNDWSRGTARSKSKKALLTLLYSLQTQNCSPFPAKKMKTTNNIGFYACHQLGFEVFACQRHHM